MSLAFSTIVLICLLAPGLAFSVFFQKGLGTRNSIFREPVAFLFTAVLLSAICHGAYLVFFDDWVSLHWSFARPVSLEVMALLVKAELPLSDLKSVIAQIESSTSQILVYFFAQTLVGSILGWFIGKVFGSSAATFRIVAPADPWLPYFLDTKKSSQFLMLAVMAEPQDENGKACIYEGIGYDVVPDGNGSIQYLTLLKACKWTSVSKNKENTQYKKISLCRTGGDATFLIEGKTIFNVLIEKRVDLDFSDKERIFFELIAAIKTILQKVVEWIKNPKEKFKSTKKEAPRTDESKTLTGRRRAYLLMKVGAVMLALRKQHPEWTLDQVADESAAAAESALEGDGESLSEADRAYIQEAVRSIHQRLGTRNSGTDTQRGTPRKSTNDPETNKTGHPKLPRV